MGVKSTVRMTREYAEERFVDLALETRDIKRCLRAAVALMSDEELEDELMRMNDAAHSGEGFENYTITETVE